MALRQESPPGLGSQVLLDPFRDPGPPLASEDFDDDEFEDAEEEQQESKMDLKIAFDECALALRKFFNNDVAGAMNIMKPWSSTSLYHSLGMSIFEFIPAMLTFDHTQICNALHAIKICLAICNKHRKNYSIVENIIKKHNYNNVTDLEAHAELCYAEALLLQAAMTILEGEDLAGLIKGTIKVRTCFNSYRECEKMLEKKEWASEESRVNFHSGVRLGLATFNVMISLLPPKFIGLLEFVGFSGNKALGLAELEAGSNSPGLRSVLCELTLLAYHLAICHFTGGECNLEISEQILEKELKVYPSGVWFLLFQGRLEFMRGRFNSALVTYERALSSQNMWRQFSYFCYWEMAWVNCLKMCWRDAALYTTRLIEESSWSRTIYSYFKAAILLQLRDDISPLERQQINDLMRNASYYKQRIAGKSLPMEKFMIKRCTRYETQGGHLVLPAVELMCLWNMFSLLANNERDAQDMLKLIEATLEELESGTATWATGYAADNLCLARYLHGCWLSAMGLPRSALDQLSTVFQYKNDLKEDTFILPYALSEMATCYHNLGDTERAIQTQQEAQKKYSGYSLESRLRLRMHSKMMIFKGKIVPVNNTKQWKHK